MARGIPPVAEPAPRTSFGWEATALAGVCGVALIAWVGPGGQARSVDVALAVLGLAGVLGALLLARQTAVPRGAGLARLAVAWGVFLGWLLLSAMISERGWNAFAGESTNGIGWLALAAMSSIALASNSLAVPLGSVLTSNAWLVVLAESLALFAQRVAGIQVSAGTLPNSTYFGEAMLLLLPWVLAEDPLPASRPSWRREGVALLGVAALAAGGARVAAVVAAAWVSWTIAKQLRLRPALRTGVVVAALAVVAVAGLTFARAEILGSASSASLGQRPDIWRAALAAVAARPILGWGPDGFMSGAAHSASPALTQAGLVLKPGSTDPHNVLLWIAASAGLVGLLLFVWFAVETALAWWRNRAPHASPAVWAVAGCTVVMFTAPAAAHVLPLFALVYGLSIAGGGATAGGQALTGTAKYGRATAAVVLGVASLALAATAATRARFDDPGVASTHRLASAAVVASRALPFDPQLASLASLHVGFAALNDPTYQTGGADLDRIRVAAMVDRQNPLYALELARTLRFLGKDSDETAEAFEEAIRRYPEFPLAHAEYAQLLATNGRAAAAREHLERAEAVREPDPELQAAIGAARNELEGDAQ